MKIPIGVLTLCFILGCCPEAQERIVYVGQTKTCDVAIRCIDTETNLPICKMYVAVSASWNNYGSWDANEKTDENGEVSFQVPAIMGAGWDGQLYVRASGYLVVCEECGNSEHGYHEIESDLSVAESPAMIQFKMMKKEWYTDFLKKQAFKNGYWYKQ